MYVTHLLIFRYIHYNTLHTVTILFMGKERMLFLTVYSRIGIRIITEIKINAGPTVAAYVAVDQGRH